MKVLNHLISKIVSEKFASSNYNVNYFRQIKSKILSEIIDKLGQNTLVFLLVNILAWLG